MLESRELYGRLTEADAVVNTRERLKVSDGVFPFRIFEYLASGAHVISVPLPPVDGLDLGWIQRWDGAPATLPAILDNAAADFEREAAVRHRTTARSAFRCTALAPYCARNSSPGFATKRGVPRTDSIRHSVNCKRRG